MLSESEYAVVFEDDVEFDPSKLNIVIEKLMKNSDIWDIVSFELVHRGTPLVIKELKHRQNLAVYLTEVSHVGAYIINREAAKELLKKVITNKDAYRSLFY